MTVVAGMLGVGPEPSLPALASDGSRRAFQHEGDLCRRGVKVGVVNAGPLQGPEPLLDVLAFVLLQDGIPFDVADAEHIVPGVETDVSSLGPVVLTFAKIADQQGILREPNPAAVQPD